MSLAWLNSVKRLPVFPLLFTHIFVSSALLVAFVLSVLSVVLWPFSKYAYRRISSLLAYSVICGECRPPGKSMRLSGVVLHNSDLSQLFRCNIFSIVVIFCFPVQYCVMYYASLVQSFLGYAMTGLGWMFSYLDLRAPSTSWARSFA